MRLVRSAYAHGRIRSVETADARALAGVVAVWTAAEIDDLPPIEFREGPNAKLTAFRQPVLAKERVRYVGEPIAAVFATDAYIAEDAAELVDVEVEEFDAIVDAAGPLGDFANGVSTEPTICRQGY